MTDELELLLEEEQEEAEAVAELLTVKAGQAPLRKNPVTAGEEDGQGESGSLADSLSALLERPAVDGFALTESVQNRHQGEQSAQSLYQVLVRTRQAAHTQQYRADRKMPLTRDPEVRVESDRDILRLDRAFQRDARRYDGGFTWQ